MELQFQVRNGQEFSRSELQLLAQKLFLPELLQKLEIVGLLEKVSILGIMEWPAPNRRPRQDWFTAHTSCNPMHDNCVFAYPCESNCLGQWFEVLNLSPQTVSDTGLGEDTKSFTSYDFTLVNTPLVTDSLFPGGCSCPFSSFVKPNCSHQFATAQQILSWFTEWMIRNKSSVFEASALKCLVALLFFFFRITRLKALILLCTGWPVCLNRSTIWAAVVPFSFRYIRKSSKLLLFVSIFSRIPWLFLNSKYKFHRFLFLSNRCRRTLTWRWSGLWISQVQCSVLANHLGFSEESAMSKILENCSTRIQLLLHRFPAILCEKRTFWILPLDLPSL